MPGHSIFHIIERRSYENIRCFLSKTPMSRRLTPKSAMKFSTLRVKPKSWRLMDSYQKPNAASLQSMLVLNITVDGAKRGKDKEQNTEKYPSKEPKENKEPKKSGETIPESLDKDKKSFEKSIESDKYRFATDTLDDDSDDSDFDDEDEADFDREYMFGELLGDLNDKNLLPLEIVKELEKYIVGQEDAKKAVAIALRNRWRRLRIDESIRDDFTPKNILMIGPTGCGKTEIARRMANLIDAPFVKAEATKYTEVGFHGRDVDKIIQDLVENALSLVRKRHLKNLAEEVDLKVEEKIVKALAGDKAAGETFESLRKLYRNGEFDMTVITIDVPASQTKSGQGSGQIPFGIRGGSAGIIPVHISVKDKNSKESSSNRESDLVSGDNQSKVLEQIFGAMGITQGPKKLIKKKFKVHEARKILEEMESDEQMDNFDAKEAAIRYVEEKGIVFIDEIDKICSNSDARGSSADASAEGVQRDLLPLIEGSVVSTKYGNVSTDHVLFICSGSFYSCSPSDLLPELQGRLPIRVELSHLEEKDLYRILTEPKTNLIRQQIELMKTEGLNLSFSTEAVKKMANIAAQVNTTVENIGARRLHTIIEKVCEDISFHGPNICQKITEKLEEYEDTIELGQRKVEEHRENSLSDNKISTGSEEMSVSAPNDADLIRLAKENLEHSDLLEFAMDEEDEICITITQEYVDKKIRPLFKKTNLERFIL